MLDDAVPNDDSSETLPVPEAHNEACIRLVDCTRDDFPTETLTALRWLLVHLCATYDVLPIIEVDGVDGVVRAEFWSARDALHFIRRAAEDLRTRRWFFNAEHADAMTAWIVIDEPEDFTYHVCVALPVTAIVEIAIHLTDVVDA